MSSCNETEYRKTNKFNVANELNRLFNKKKIVMNYAVKKSMLSVTMHDEDKVGIMELKNEMSNGREEEDLARWML